MFLPHPRVKLSNVGSLRDREVACSASDRQGSNFESCVWRTVSSHSSHHPQEVILAQFSLYTCAQRWPKARFISFHFPKSHISQTKKCYDKYEMIRAFGRATFVHIQAKLGKEIFHEMNQMTQIQDSHPGSLEVEHATPQYLVLRMDGEETFCHDN